MDAPLSLGNIAYNAYCESTNWKSVYTGADLPQYDQQRPEVIQAWESSALAVAATICSTKSVNDVAKVAEPFYAYGAVDASSDVPTTNLSNSLGTCSPPGPLGCPAGPQGDDGLQGSDETVNTDVDEEYAPDETYAIKA